MKLGLEWGKNVFLNVDRPYLRIDVGDSKNGEGREFILTMELKELFEDMWIKRCDIQERTGVVSPYVFIYWSGKKAGLPIRSFKGAWKAACIKAGCPGMHFHDNRRTAVRRLVRTPRVGQKIAMQLTGHKTPSVFQRYNITAREDLIAAADALDAVNLATGKDMGKDSAMQPVRDTLND